MDQTSVVPPDRCDSCRMCLTPACPRSPVLLSRHGTRCIRHRWRHAGWLSIGHKSPCGRWHRYPRLESADGTYAWLDPAEPWQVGRQYAKTRKTNRVRPNMRAQKRFTDRPPEYGLQVSNRRWLPISDTYHVSPECDLRTGRVPLDMEEGMVKTQLCCPMRQPSGEKPVLTRPSPPAFAVSRA